jgi:hypothetical protein
VDIFVKNPADKPHNPSVCALFDRLMKIWAVQSALESRHCAPSLGLSGFGDINPSIGAACGHV